MRKLEWWLEPVALAVGWLSVNEPIRMPRIYYYNYNSEIESDPSIISLASFVFDPTIHDLTVDWNLIDGSTTTTV